MLHAALLMFPLFMVFAACMDLFTMRIPNYISIALTVAFLPLALICGLSTTEIGLQYSCGFFVLCVTFTLFAFGKIGGGDAKLAAASAIWIGWEYVLDYMTIASLLGGVMAIFFLAVRRAPLPRVLMQTPWIIRLHDPKGGIPYAIALGLGGVIVYPQTPLWLLAVGG